MEIKIAIIGGGIAGLSIARDLAIRGFNVTIFDKQKIGHGTTTQCAGMLHSGARYATKDIKTAKICFNENKIVRKILSHAVGKRKAFFVRYYNDEPEYEKEFVNGCKKIGIPIRKISGKTARELEPKLGPGIEYVFETPDVVVDTFSLIFSYLDDLRGRKNVSIFEGVDIKKASRENGVWKVNAGTNLYPFDFVINSSGDGLATVGKKFGANIELSYIYGSMALFKERLVSRIITRCAPNTTGDVIVPGVGVTLVGSTWHERGKPSKVNLTKKDVIEVKETASKMLPRVDRQRLITSLTSVRTHLKDSSYSNSFGNKRDYLIYNYQINDGVENLLSVLPGKMTIARYVAEKVGDHICQKFGVPEKSKTAQIPLEKPTRIRRKFKFYLN